MIVVDTTVLVYAVGGEHRLREPCRQLVAAIGDERVSATTTVEAIQEFAHVRARRCGRADAAARALELATLLGPLLRTGSDELSRGLELFVSHPRLGAFDAVLAATALIDQRVTTLVSADSAFADVPGLAYLDPASPDFARRVGIEPADAADAQYRDR